MSLRRLLPALAILCLALPFAVGSSTVGAPLRVAVFNGNGASPTCVRMAVEACRIDPVLAVREISAAEIVSGGLRDVDVIVFPGGGGGRQRTDLGDAGAEEVRRFVLDRGRGAVGLCAGAYLLSDTPEYACLRLFPARAVDREHDERGHGVIAFDTSPAGLDILPELRGWGTCHIYYYEGPILEPSEGGSPRYSVLASMKSDVHLENDAPAGMTPGRPLLLTAESGRGRVFLSVGHPEATPGLRWIVPRAVRWAARREPASYAPGVVRPGLLGGEILFDSARRASESACHQDLMYGTAPARAKAVRNLAAMRSWDGPLWIRGLLRDADPAVRLTAARALLDLEWTAAEPDLKAAASSEKDAETRAALLVCLERMGALAPAAVVRGGEGGRREVAVTVDDLPLVSAGTSTREGRLDITRRLVKGLRTEGIPAVGFVVGARPNETDRDALLAIWLEAGLELGNHTGSHPSRHRVSAEEYEADVLRGEEALRPLLARHGKALRWFRHPMLHTGRSAEDKRALEAFLAQRGLNTAAVTHDNSEWIFARAYSNALERGDAEAARRVREAYVPYMEARFDYFERQS
ncbi:MAG: polysaccharide deacetylase family protein, partial [Acidobacteriota bacterium]